MRKFIKENAIQSVVDLGCGDWQFSPYIYHDLDVAYLGYDVVLSVTEETPEGNSWTHQRWSTGIATDYKTRKMGAMGDPATHKPGKSPGWGSR